jgi:hypothetical protein
MVNWGRMGEEVVKTEVKHYMNDKTSFAEVLEAADHLPLEDQEALVDVLQRRIIERRRGEILKEIHKAHKEYQEGRTRPATAADILAEILQ